MEQVKRVASALVILPPLIVFLSYASPPLFLVLLVGLIVLSTREYWQLLRKTQLLVRVDCCTVASVWIALMTYCGGQRGMSVALLSSMVALTVTVLCLKHDVSRLFPLLLYSMGGVLGIGWTLSHLMLLRNLPHGQWYVLFLCLVVWAGDTAAMYVGKSLGRHKLAPTVSPGKTWEGALGGVAGGVLAALCSAGLLLAPMTLWEQGLLGVGITLAGQVSDLGESLLKRYVGVKDSGELIPGHGGILDRMDSMLFAAPTCLYALEMLLSVARP